MKKFTSEVVIGLEIHVELDTKSKLFCGCARKGREKPNNRCCEICLGHPGSRPMLNKKALDFAIKLCLALGCRLAKELVFSRKSYFYPDMSKNFQITQFEKPLGSGGKLRLRSGKEIRLRRIHLEEDPASLTYPAGMEGSSYVLIDYNRAGNPLIEVVTEPELCSPEEARDFLNQLIGILSYLKIFKVGSCAIKTDANLSIKESGYTRVEIKNITGFKEIERALAFEVARQKDILRRGEKVRRETRGWSEVRKSTVSLRGKETEEDYGYIIEPDLSMIDITEEMVSCLRKEIPELGQQRAERYMKEYGLEKVDAEVMAMELELAELFEKVAAKVEPRLAARWLRRELLRVLNYHKKTIRDIKFGEKEIVELLSLVEKGEISETTGQRIMERLMEKRFSPLKYVEKYGLGQIGSEGEVRKVCRKVVEEYKKAVEDYLAGEEKAFHYLLGQVMKLTRGKAEPGLANKMLKEEIGKGK